MRSGFLGVGIGPRAFGGGASGVLTDPVPVAGPELLANGGFESWTDATHAASWTLYNTGTFTIDQDAAIVSAGSYAARLSSGAASGAHSFYQDIAAASYAWLRISWSARASAAQALTLSCGGTIFPVTPGDAWTQYLHCVRNTTFPRFSLFVHAPTAGSVAYFDAVSCVPLALSTLISTQPYASADCDLSAAITRTAGTQAGLCARLDSDTSPANFIIAYLDGAGWVRVDKCVAGTYTNVIDGAVTYAAGRVLRLVCSGNNVSCYYNGAQVGSTVTVSDAGIVSNVNHGKFSTYASNTLANYVAA